MAFNYNKHKLSEESGNYWTSYSDLFMGLSVVFLLLYVTTSLRTGTSGLQQQMENQKLSMEVQDLKNQLKMYDSIKKDYMKNQASQDDQKLYEELMDKLTLLQEEAKDEKLRLTKEAQENQKKEVALNQYQQMVRNIINANVLAKTKINKRDVIIGEQDQEISNQSNQITNLQSEVSTKEKLIAEGEQKIDEAEKKLKNQMKQLQNAYKLNKLSKAEFAKQMESLKADNQKQIGELQALNNSYSDQLGSAQKKLNELSGNLAVTQKRLGAAEAEKGQLKSTLAGKEADLEETKAHLAKARAEADARKNVAKQIQNEFRKAGVKADVDEGTGEVILDFGEAYFENDSAKIKSKMADVLRKAMPGYAKSLLGNKEVAKNISAVEIIGFASPTYKGRYVDPNSLDVEDRKALTYNMDLSYSRARSIMQYIFDKSNMEFPHQKDMLPLVKVSGRSFLDEAKAKRTVANDIDFCKKYDCKKAQRVIIRFSMDGKSR